MKANTKQRPLMVQNSAFQSPFTKLWLSRGSVLFQQPEEATVFKGLVHHAMASACPRAEHNEFLTLMGESKGMCRYTTKISVPVCVYVSIRNQQGDYFETVSPRERGRLRRHLGLMTQLICNPEAPIKPAVDAVAEQLLNRCYAFFDDAGYQGLVDLTSRNTADKLRYGGVATTPDFDTLTLCYDYVVSDDCLPRMSLDPKQILHGSHRVTSDQISDRLIDYDGISIAKFRSAQPAVQPPASLARRAAEQAEFGL